MPSRLPAVALAAVATMGLASACEKQSPYVTLTAGGTVVKARAARYCRGDECSASTDQPTLEIRSGDTLGIDVPRSLAEQGWRLGRGGEISHDHYHAEQLPQLQPGGEPITLSIFRDERHGFGEWRFTLVVK
ncbi:MAG TPA: DUF2771 family protein [Mycobacteriales bacterium]|jgi:hypothetical protein